MNNTIFNAVNGKIDTNIFAWINKANNVNINIDEQNQALHSLDDHIRQKTEREEINKLIFCKEIIYTGMIKKILQGVDSKIQTELNELKHKCAVWTEKADFEGVDAKEELNFIEKVDQESSQVIKKYINQGTIEEIANRRCIAIRTLCFSKIILKIYESKIHKFAEEAKTQTHDGMIVDGIAKEATAALTTNNFKWLDENAEKIFNCFIGSVQLLIHEPEKYHEEADRVWIRRNILSITHDFKYLAKKEKKEELIEQIDGLCKNALERLTEEKKLVEFQALVNKNCAGIAEKIGENAQRLWLETQIYQVSIYYNELAKKKQMTHLHNQIASCYNSALEMIDNKEIPFKDLEARIKNAFSLLEGRIGESLLDRYCGFNEK